MVIDNNESEEIEEIVIPPRKFELTLNEAEVLKISPQPGEVLFFKFKGEEFQNDDVNELGRQLRKMFPANKVIVMALPPEHDVEIAAIANQDIVVAEDCSKPTAYCNSCGCGKKERIEAERAANGSPTES